MEGEATGFLVNEEPTVITASERRGSRILRGEKGAV